MASPNLDPVSFAVAVVGSLVGLQMAHFVGTYIVILIMWFGGMLVGIFRLPPESKISVAGFVVVSFVVTIGTSWVSASWLASQVSIESTILVVPVAAVIPAIGHSWLEIGKWFAEFLGARWSKGQ